MIDLEIVIAMHQEMLARLIALEPHFPSNQLGLYLIIHGLICCTLTILEGARK